jgi:hypothetical protein
MKFPKIHFAPSTKEEKEYLKKLNSILRRKRYGDWLLVAKSINQKQELVSKAFSRVYSKNHIEVVKALEKVIEEREKKLLE